MRISVDWDGTLVENVWPQEGNWLPGAVEALRAMLDAGHEVKVYTCRIGPYEVDELTHMPHSKRVDEIEYIRRMLRRAGLGAVKVWTKKGKPGADVYIDDKGLRFEGDWGTTMRMVNGIERTGRPVPLDV